ncbi:hypothetical protein PR048_020026 [Dryococelus australis]|uniref:Uncharacterized protein n=1 Tax=Dryococelus australis TaxID=614101 RepID=A0ABQ9H561_9NEOP|nr:hypothetical protein PR048_020026 [Dryococelus australis]
MIKEYHDAYYKLRKSYHRDKNQHSFKKKIENFVAEDIECDCEKDKKIPCSESKFMYDQQNTRMGYIGSKKGNNYNFQENGLSDFEKCESEDTINSSRDRKNENNESISIPSTSQIRIKLPATALMSDRFGVSDRATTAVASNVLQDIGLITEKQKA